MNFSKINAAVFYRLLLVSASLIILVGGSFVFPPSLSWDGLLALTFTAVVFCYPLVLSIPEISLVQVITLGIGLASGLVTAGWGAAIGIVIGFSIRQTYRGYFKPKRYSSKPAWLDAAFQFSLQIVPLSLALYLTDWIRGVANDPELAARIWPEAVYTILLFGLFHFIFFAIAQWIDPRESLYPKSYVGTLALLIEAASLPFVLINLLALPLIGTWSILTLVGITSLIAVFINRAGAARQDLERRVLDLSMLNQVSSVLQSTLDLEKLLEVIHVQVTQLLKVNNFYVALYRPDEQQVWYPLAVKHGVRQEWPARPLVPDRLTDRIIKEGKPYLLTPGLGENHDRIGLPASEETPYAWMGVPLITPERTIGCLAVYSIDPEAQFTRADLNLLTTLSGQVSVAIENALLLGQARQRARQLETLNRISSLITASLDLEEVLDQVCHSVIQVGSCQRSAIFLFDTETGHVSLAHSTGLSSAFSQANGRFYLADEERMRSLQAGNAVLISTLNKPEMDSQFIKILQAEGISASGEFPLITPDGCIGFLSVYYEAPHTFPSEETELLQTFASQAALAVSNARLYAHTDKALSQRVQQLAILEAVGRELAAAINSEQIFERILNYALEFTNSQWGELSLYNKLHHTLDVKAAHGYPKERLTFSTMDGLAEKAIETRQVINIGEVLGESGYIDLTSSQAHSKLCVPLVHEDRVLGVLALESEKPNAYHRDDEAFILQLALQAAVAVVNAELYSETQRRLSEQSILYLVTTHLVGTQPIDRILETLARAIQAAFQPVSAISIYLLDKTGDQYISQPLDQSEKNSECRLPEAVPVSKLEQLRTALEKTTPLKLTNRKGQELLGSCKDCQALVFPMTAEQRPLGIALIHIPKAQTIHDEEIQLLKTIVAQVSLSLQNAMLFADVRNGRDRMAAILNSVGEGILMMDTAERVMLANEFILKITGLTRTEIISQRLVDLSEIALKALGYTLEEAKALTAETASQTGKKTIQVSASGLEKVLVRTTAPVLGRNDQAIGWMIVLRDVTEENQLEQARELIANTLIHDLRSPVGAVLSALDIVDTSLPVERPEMIEQGLLVARNSASRVLGLVDSLLDIARMEAGVMDLQLNQVDLISLINTVVADLQLRANDYGIDLRSDLPAEFPRVLADQSKISRVIGNLLDNALKFTPAGGEVVISAAINSTWHVLVSVGDTGQGVPLDYRDKIFERFSTVPGQHSRRRGSGLGLTFCKMVVEAHHGRIWYEPRKESANGSIFAFTLPINHPEEVTEEKEILPAAM